MGCKRITPSDTYLAAFNRENVHLVTDKVANYRLGIVINAVYLFLSMLYYRFTFEVWIPSYIFHVFTDRRRSDQPTDRPKVNKTKIIL